MMENQYHKSPKDSLAKDVEYIAKMTLNSAKEGVANISLIFIRNFNLEYLLILERRPI